MERTHYVVLAAGPVRALAGLLLAPQVLDCIVLGGHVGVEGVEGAGGVALLVREVVVVVAQLGGARVVAGTGARALAAASTYAGGACNHRNTVGRTS